MAGIGQKIKDVAQKVTGGSRQEEGYAGGHRDVTGAGTGLGTAGSAYGTEPRTEYTGGVAGGPAYGGTEGAAYTERAEGYAEVPVVQQTTTTTTTAAAPVAVGGQAVAQQGEAAVCAQEYFTKVEDRPVVKERVELIQEHRPVEKEFVVETRATGVEREIAGGQVEHLGTTERIVSVTPPKAPCE